MQDAPATVHEELSRPGHPEGRDLFVLVLAIAVALLVVAGVLVYVLGNSTTESTSARLEGALVATRSAATADISLHVKTSFGGVSFSIAAVGAVDFPTSSSSLRTNAFGQQTAVVETNGVVYVKLGKVVSNRFPGKTWVRIPVSAITHTHDSRRVATDDPQRLLSVLLKVGTVTPTGTAPIDGTQDQGYRVRLTVADLEAHASELPPAVRPLFATSKRLPKSAEISARMYVDPAGLLQAVRVTVTQRKAHLTSVSFDLTMSHFGTASVPVAPPARQTVTYRRLDGSFGALSLT